MVFVRKRGSEDRGVRRIARTALVGTVCLVSAAAAASEPDVRQTLADASAAYDDGRYAACGRLYAMAVEEQGQPGSGSPYNAACCYSLAGDRERAFELLDTAVERGWNDAEHLETDPDLAGLRDDPRWAPIVDRVKAARTAYLQTVNAELLRIYEEDQADRQGEIDWSRVAPRDEARHGRVLELLAAGDVKAADDYFHAAMVLQHGSEPDDYRRAHELALKAVELDPDQRTAKWLAAAARDRYLQSVGEPQIYGTQFRLVDGTWTLDPIDEDAVTDEERARWGVPPLAEARRRAAEMNGERTGDR